MRPAVFLDRDGTMVHDANYLSRIEDLHWYPFTIDAVRLLNRAGFVVGVTTNQGGIGLGLFTEDFLRGVHDSMAATLAAAGAHVDGWYFCPHHPRATVDALRIACTCRKPGIGMIQEATAELDVDLARSFVIGDRAADMGMAHAAGLRGVLVRTGTGEEALAEHRGAVPGAAHVAMDLMAATAWILAQSGHPHRLT